jgi:hypothetical protein
VRAHMGLLLFGIVIFLPSCKITWLNRFLLGHMGDLFYPGVGLDSDLTLVPESK